jgi:hypothetical protein
MHSQTNFASLIHWIGHKLKEFFYFQEIKVYLKQIPQFSESYIPLHGSQLPFNVRPDFRLHAYKKSCSLATKFSLTLCLISMLSLKVTSVRLFEREVETWLSDDASSSK